MDAHNGFEPNFADVTISKEEMMRKRSKLVYLLDFPKFKITLWPKNKARTATGTTCSYSFPSDAALTSELFNTRVRET